MATPELVTDCECPAEPGIDWAAVLAEHDRWLRTVVLARVGQRQAVDEVIQEVSLAAVAQKSPLADPAKVAPWLYRLAVRKSLLYRRQRGRERRLSERYGQRLVERQAADESSAADPLAWLLRNERRQLVLEALQHLPRRELELLLLKYTEDWSYRELAERLGMSPSAVEARLHRARGHLRAQLVKARLIEDNERCTR